MEEVTESGRGRGRVRGGAGRGAHGSSYFFMMLYVILVAVLHFAGYMRYFGVWVFGFVNCVKYFDKTSLVCKIAIGKKPAIAAVAAIILTMFTIKSERVHTL